MLVWWAFLFVHFGNYVNFTTMVILWSKTTGVISLVNLFLRFTKYKKYTWRLFRRSLYITSLVYTRFCPVLPQHERSAVLCHPTVVPVLYNTGLCLLLLCSLMSSAVVLHVLRPRLCAQDWACGRMHRLNHMHIYALAPIGMYLCDYLKLCLCESIYSLGVSSMTMLLICTVCKPMQPVTRARHLVHP